jgi:hypothetical protein
MECLQSRTGKADDLLALMEHQRQYQSHSSAERVRRHRDRKASR